MSHQLLDQEGIEHLPERHRMVLELLDQHHLDYASVADEAFLSRARVHELEVEGLVRLVDIQTRLRILERGQPVAHIPYGVDPERDG